jgi:hypothetical protein
VNYYPDQLRGIAAMCEALNKADGLDSPDCGVVFAQKLPLVHPDEPNVILGYLIDEIGGSWSFEPNGGAA